MMPAVIGEKAPNLRLSEWVQGIPTNFDQEKDHIVIVEVFHEPIQRDEDLALFLLLQLASFLRCLLH